jgi:hypothetical protein
MRRLATKNQWGGQRMLSKTLLGMLLAALSFGTDCREGVTVTTLKH